MEHLNITRAWARVRWGNRGWKKSVWLNSIQYPHDICFPFEIFIIHCPRLCVVCAFFRWAATTWCCYSCLKKLMEATTKKSLPLDLSTLKTTDNECCCSLWKKIHLSLLLLLHIDESNNKNNWHIPRAHQASSRYCHLKGRMVEGDAMLSLDHL